MCLTILGAAEGGLRLVPAAGLRDQKDAEVVPEAGVLRVQVQGTPHDLLQPHIPVIPGKQVQGKGDGPGVLAKATHDRVMGELGVGAVRKKMAAQHGISHGVSGHGCGASSRGG
jgi:hypothetical protein